MMSTRPPHDAEVNRPMKIAILDDYLDTLRTLIAYRGLREGKHADFGVLADVAQPGRVRVGDRVTVLD